MALRPGRRAFPGPDTLGKTLKDAQECLLDKSVTARPGARAREKEGKPDEHHRRDTGSQPWSAGHV